MIGGDVVLAQISLTLAFLGMLIAFCMFSIIRFQHRQIERLQDRLTDRNHGGYMSTQTRAETPEEPKREPLSWYDDPDVEDDEQQQ